MRARRARVEYEAALHLMRGSDGAWNPPVLTCSAMEGRGLAELWEKIEEHHATLTANGELERKRHAQGIDWTWSMVKDGLFHALVEHPDVKAIVPALESDVRDGKLTATAAARRILAAFGVKRAPYATSRTSSIFARIAHPALGKARGSKPAVPGSEAVPTGTPKYRERATLGFIR